MIEKASTPQTPDRGAEVAPGPVGWAFVPELAGKWHFYTESKSLCGLFTFAGQRFEQGIELGIPYCWACRTAVGRKSAAAKLTAKRASVGGTYAV